MREVLFSKYSGERNPQFAIRTSIIQDGEKKWVEKVPLTKEATAHIEKLGASYEKLREIYKGTKLHPCPVRIENGIAKFEFIEGVSFHDKLGKLIVDHDEEGIIALCKKYVSLIKSRTDIVPFQKTPEFIEIFGDISLPDGLTGTAFSNMDATFDNLIEIENGEIALLDYEWCFDFPIPLEYNLYRALFFTFEKWGMCSFLDQKLCPILGIEEALFYTIWQIEKAFDSFMRKGDELVPIWQGYEHIRERSFDWQEELNRQHRELTQQKEEIQWRLDQIQQAYDSIANSTCWRMTKPLRVFLDWAKKFLKSNFYTHLFCKGLKCLILHGPKFTLVRAREKLLPKKIKEYTKKELEHQRQATFPLNVKFSILVPLYNTPRKFLEEMIQSVMEQTYGGWELCMADGSDGEHCEVGEICKKYAEKDFRIKYRKLEKNLGISENTNACIDMAEGDYIGLLDHDDILHPAAFYEAMKVIYEQNADFIYTDEATFISPNIDRIVTAHFKPDFAIDNLRANNYICHFSVFKRELLDNVGRFRHEYDGSQDHDMILRLTAKAKIICHIPRVLYFWRSHNQSVSQNISAKEYAVDAAKCAVSDNALKNGYMCSVESTKAFPTIFRLKYNLKIHPMVSIIIPTKNNLNILRRCIESIESLTTYSNYEVVIIDNDSKDKSVFEYYELLKSHGNFSICSLNEEFNYSRLNNFAIKKAKGEYYIFLNNDTEVISPNWIEEMLMYVQRDDVAAAGAMLYYPDNTIQHAGVILGMGENRIAGHPFHKYPRGDTGYMGRLCYAQNMSAVTAACMMVKASVYKRVGGFDENLAVAYNDIDLCLKIRKEGYLIIWTPFAELYHYESKTRGYEDTEEKRKRLEEEAQYFRSRWKEVLEQGDPYYNPNLTLEKGDFSLR